MGDAVDDHHNPDLPLRVLSDHKKNKILQKTPSLYLQSSEMCLFFLEGLRRACERVFKNYSAHLVAITLHDGPSSR